MNIGEKIKKLRIANCESQQKLAEVLGVSFQSVSKWENDQSYPEITMLKRLADYYRVTTDYLLDDKQTEFIPKIARQDKNIDNIKKAYFKVTVNKISSFQVWTDFQYEDTIAPLSVLDKSRRRTGAMKLNSPSDLAEMFTIAIDKDGKITYAGKNSGWSFSSPCDPFYSRSIKEEQNMECFILGDTYMRWEAGNRESWEHCNDYEFVIPKDGMVLVFKPNDYKYIKLFDIILNCAIKDRNLEFKYGNRSIDPADFITYSLMSGELDHITITLDGDEMICVSYTEKESKEIVLSDDFSTDELKKYIRQEIKNALSSMNLTELAYLPDKVAALADEVEEIRDEFIDVQDQLEEAQDQLEDSLTVWNAAMMILENNEEK